VGGAGGAQQKSLFERRVEFARLLPDRAGDLRHLHQASCREMGELEIGAPKSQPMTALISPSICGLTGLASAMSAVHLQERKAVAKPGRCSIGVATMADFAVIPALDLKDGGVVQAKAGDRADYRPIASPFGAADDPVAIARRLLALTGSPSLYIADLDAIAGTGNHFELVRGISDALPGVTVWIDAGFSNVADCAFWLPLGAT